MTNSEKELIDKLNALIANQVHDTDLSNEAICMELGVSRSQLYRLLKEEFQLSPSIYIRKRKLLTAKELLENSEMKIAEVAYHIGIDSPQNFTKYFTQEYGFSPTEFRRGLSTFAENVNQEIQDPTEQFIEKQTITETKTERTIEEKITFEQKITEAITERKIETERKTQKTIAIPIPITKKLPQKLIYSLYFLSCCLLVGAGFFVWQMGKNEAEKEVKKEALAQVPTPFAESSYQHFSENSIAILPFKNLGKAENAIFCDGVMEQIHASLSQLENLKVISKTSSNQFRDTQKTIPQIANDLHVSYLLEGSVMQIDTQVRITVQLIRTKEDRAIWSKSYDGNAKEVFAYMSTVAKEVARELNQKLSQTESKKLDKIPTQNLEAYNEYLQAKQLTQTRVKDKLEASIVKFKKAITLDSMFSEAYSYQALAYWLLFDSKYIDIQEAHKMTEQNALTAIRLDSENALAYAILANLYRDQNKWEQANTTYLIALKYNPNDALINYWYSLMLRSLGRLDEAVRYSSKAVTLDPLYPVIMAGHILNCILGGKLDLAQQNIKAGELLFNESWVYYWARGYFNISQKDYSMALKEFNKSHELNPKVKIVNHLVYFCKAKLGMEKEVNEYLKTLSLPDNYTGFIVIHAGLGNKELAMTYLQQNAALGNIPTDLKVMSYYQIFQGDKRYEAILEQFGLGVPKPITQ